MEVHILRCDLFAFLARELGSCLSMVADALLFHEAAAMVATMEVSCEFE